MATSGAVTGGVIVTFAINVDAKPIADALIVVSVNVEKKVNCIPIARIIILDGSADTGTFDASSSSTFVPGASITIEAGYDLSNSLIFKGIITKQTIRVDSLVGSALEIECMDVAVKMTVSRKCVTFVDKKDSDIIASIVSSYGLSANITATNVVRPQQVQYYVTDWAYIVSQAEANGLLVVALNGKISVVKPDADTTPIITVGYGESLLEFNASLNSVSQLGSITSNSWDYAQQMVNTANVVNSIAGPGNLTSKALSEVVEIADYRQQTTAALNTTELTIWSNAQVIKSAYAKILGNAKFQGTCLVEPGKYITLQGLGDRFNGDHIISGVTHNINDGNWFTEVAVGLPADWLIEKADVIAPPASGLLPATRGLLNGTVKAIGADPDNQFRILVNVPMFDQCENGLWARLSNFYSSSDAGAFFLPEVGDEVVLGFLNEDPRYPVILGSMYSNPKLKTPFAADQINSIKGLKSRSGITIQFDDENEVLTLSTPAGNNVVISDKDKQVTIKDQNSNSIIMAEDGITIKSEKNINFEAGQQINIKGTQGINIQASGGDVNVNGINIKEIADMQYSATGAETAELMSGMQLTLKSAMIMIN